jgi:hypothetical protein
LKAGPSVFAAFDSGLSSFFTVFFAAIFYSFLAELTCFPFLVNITFLVAVSAVSYIKSAPFKDYRRRRKDTTTLTPTLGTNSTSVFWKTLFYLEPQ